MKVELGPGRRPLWWLTPLLWALFVAVMAAGVLQALGGPSA